MNDKITRRNMLKSGVLVSTPAFFSVTTSADTDTGSVEISTDADIPAGTFVYLRIFEDTSGSGTADKQQEIEIFDGVNTYEYGALDGYIGQTFQYWFDLTLESNTDQTETPIVNSIEIALPGESNGGGTIPDNEVWGDNFEDGNANGWENAHDNIVADVSQDSYNGDWSLYAETSYLSTQDRPSYDWIEGPSLDMREYFRIQGTAKINWVTFNQNVNIRMGITGNDQGQEGENAYLLFNKGNDETYLGTWNNQGSGNADTIQSVFENQWFNFIVRSEEGSNVLQAKVWGVDQNEPENWLERADFEGIGGQFGVNVGHNESNANRQIYLDNIRLEGTTYIPDDEGIELDFKSYLEPETSIPYTIRAIVDGEWKDVTNEAEITSSNPNLVNVLTEENQLESYGKYGESIVTATYDGRERGKIVSVAPIEVGSLPLLPFPKKVEAVLTDTTMQVIFASTFSSLAIKKLVATYGDMKNVNAWIKLGMAFLIIVLAGTQGFVSNGIAFASVFFVILAYMIMGNVRNDDTSVVVENGGFE